MLLANGQSVRVNTHVKVIVFNAVRCHWASTEISSECIQKLLCNLRQPSNVMVQCGVV